MKKLISQVVAPDLGACSRPFLFGDFLDSTGVFHGIVYFGGSYVSNLQKSISVLSEDLSDSDIVRNIRVVSRNFNAGDPTGDFPDC